jgi:RNA 2',3'-cyclic 3'-phosphodiesterase
LLRCFVAVEVASPALCRALEGAQSGLKRAFGLPDPVKWVPAHQFHFTLKFLGEIPEEAAGRAVAALERVTAGLAPFPLRSAGLGGFPTAERPSVLWAGVTDGKAELSALADAVERELVADGFPRERKPFKPHLTLGRVREGARVPAAVPQMLAQAHGQEFGTARVERVVLMRSELTPRGSIYTVHGFSSMREENA